MAENPFSTSSSRLQLEFMISAILTNLLLSNKPNIPQIEQLIVVRFEFKH